MDKNEAYDMFFNHPGMWGWKLQKCSLCGVVHPSTCDVGRDPEFQRRWEQHVKEREERNRKNKAE